MAEISDFECGFAEGYDRGFAAGRNPQPLLAQQVPYWQQPLTAAAQPYFTPGCSCPPGNVCTSLQCPRRAYGTTY